MKGDMAECCEDKKHCVPPGSWCTVARIPQLGCERQRDTNGSESVEAAVTAAKGFGPACSPVRAPQCALGCPQGYLRPSPVYSRAARVL